MKILVTVILTVLLTSCGMYSYRYDETSREIMSEQEIYITSIFIDGDNGIGASFIQKPDKKVYRVSIDSLNYYFTCRQGGCPFAFEKGKEYKISILPAGDRHLAPLVIKY
ncbi:hypothetical protein AAEO56_02405 [Flavobacterium sp. DGU11]|uniref:Lipoprotein n=1 Tax=Flavobacterium arundinis TaxID=3139143 RepID=A0ABU9HT75_9FLAO